MHYELYITCYDITSDHIRVRQQAYEALGNDDLTTSLRFPYYLFYIPFGNVLDLTPSMIRINKQIITSDDYIACLSLNSFFAVYKAQEQKTIFDQ